MTARRKWVLIPGISAIAVAATMLSAYAGSQTAEQPADAAAPANETATQRANREAFGKAQPGPWAYSGASGYTFYIGGGIGRSPEQPVKFPHPVHVNALKMNCAFCHNAAGQSPDPGLPAVGTCMACHAIVGADRPRSRSSSSISTRGSRCRGCACTRCRSTCTSRTCAT